MKSFNYISKVNISIIILLFSILNLNAQKEDYNWIFGEQDDSRVIFNFENEVLNVDTFITSMTFTGTNASISDSLGKLLFYTNGLRLYDARKNELISNGDSLSTPSSYWNFANNFYQNYRLPQTSLILKSIQDKTEFEVFSLKIDTILTDNIGFINKMAGANLLRTKIYYDNDSLWVSEKNNNILNDTLLMSNLTACRHANGRDWWLVCQKGLSNCVNVLLYTPDSIYLHHQECSGLSYSSEDLGVSTFSSDGSKFVSASGLNGIKIYDFDRCDGNLILLEQIPRDDFMDSADNISGYFGTIAISPNSRYLYTSPFDSLYQFDLQATDILASKHLVKGRDPNNMSIYAFGYMHLGVDGKIYVSASGTPNYHRINNPNEANTIDFDMMLDLPKNGSASYGNFPNFRLGRLIGSTCDTLYNNLEEFTELNVLEAYPNPANTKIRIEYAGKFWEQVNDLHLRITNVLGQEFHYQKLPEYSAKQIIDVQNYPSGVYFVSLVDEGSVLGSIKFVKQ